MFCTCTPACTHTCMHKGLQIFLQLFRWLSTAPTQLKALPCPCHSSEGPALPMSQVVQDYNIPGGLADQVSHRKHKLLAGMRGTTCCCHVQVACRHARHNMLSSCTRCLQACEAQLCCCCVLSCLPAWPPAPAASLGRTCSVRLSWSADLPFTWTPPPTHPAPGTQGYPGSVCHLLFGSCWGGQPEPG